MEYASKRTTNNYSDDENNHVLLRDGYVGMDNGGNGVEDMFNIAELNGHYFGSDYTDENGNIRILRVYWKSLKKVKK